MFISAAYPRVGTGCRIKKEEDVNYLHTDVLDYAAKVMAATKDHEGIRCGWLLEHAGRPCGEPATYLAAGSGLVADDTGIGARDEVQSGPQWLCRKHLVLILDGPPEDQPVFGHTTSE